MRRLNAGDSADPARNHPHFGCCESPLQPIQTS